MRDYLGDLIVRIKNAQRESAADNVKLLHSGKIATCRLDCTANT